MPLAELPEVTQAGIERLATRYKLGKAIVKLHCVKNLPVVIRIRTPRNRGEYQNRFQRSVGWLKFCDGGPGRRGAQQPTGQAGVAVGDKPTASSPIAFGGVGETAAYRMFDDEHRDWRNHQVACLLRGLADVVDAGCLVPADTTEPNFSGQTIEGPREGLHKPARAMLSRHAT